MSEILTLLELIVRGLPAALAQPRYFPFFWIVVGLVALQYRRVAEGEQRLYGVVKNNAVRQVLIALGFGLIGGVVASVIMAVVGVSLSGAGVTWLLPLALLLMAISPRLMCFSYAGGIISVSYLLFGWPKVHVPAIMALVAVLHLTESLLIYLRGAGCTTPVTVRNADAGATRTGFLMQGFWPLPLLLLFVVSLPPDAPRDGLMEMPTWWPLIVPPAEVAAQENAVFTLFPVAAVLGYSDLAARFSPRRKANRSAVMLLGYSVILLALAVLSAHQPATVWLVALWGPLGHELVVRLGSRGEFAGRAALTADPAGLTVLDVLPGGGAQAAGLRTGDVILDLDGRPAGDQAALAEVLSGPPRSVAASVRRDGRVMERTIELKPLGPDGGLAIGVIPVPSAGENPQMEIRNRGYLATLWDRLRRRLKR